MATKKAATAKKARAKSQPAKTTVTTVKAVEVTKSSATRSTGDRRTILAAALIGEFIGTFMLVAAFLVSGGEYLYVGLTLVGLILTVGTLSGAYLNPLLTVGGWVTRKLSHLRAVGYLVAQLLGAAAAFAALTAFVSAGASAAGSSSFTQAPELFHFNPLTDKNQWYIFGAELVASSVLAFAFAGALIEKTDRVAKALTVGLTLLGASMVAGLAAKSLAASVAINPAIALAAKGVDFSAFTWGAVVVYIAAPLIGGIVGFALRDFVETK